MRFVLVLAVCLAGCVDDFPPVRAAARGALDDGVSSDMTPDQDRGADPDDGVPRDGAVDPDDGVPPMDLGPQPDRALDAGRCTISATVDTVILRTWEDVGADAQIEIDTDCPFEISAPDWVTVEPVGDDIKIATPAARGYVDGVITLTTEDDQLELKVQRVGLAQGEGTRRALIYVVDGLKGESLAVSRPPAIDFLARNARLTWQGVPHRPADDASRATAWASLLTGLAPAEHQFMGGGLIGAPTFLQRLGEAAVALHFEWTTIADATRGTARDRREVIERSVRAIDSGARLIVAGVDGLFESPAGDLTSRQDQLDADLDLLLSVIARQPGDDDWMIIVTTAAPGGEGPPTIPVIVAAPRQSALMVDAASLMDVHTTALGWLDVLRPGWALPGDQIGGPGEAACEDNLDNDGDGRIDCRDAQCAARCALGCVDVDLGARLGTAAIDVTLADFDDRRGSCARDQEPSSEVTATWIAPRNGYYTISTLDSNFDTVLEIVDRDCDGEQVICNDDAVDGLQSSWSGFREEGQPVLISVSSFRATRPEWRARMSIQSISDACESAPEIDGEVRLDNNNTPHLMPANGAAGSAYCDKATANRLVRWDAPAGRWRVRLQAEFDSSVALWKGACAGGFQFIECGDEAFDVTITEEDAGPHLFVVSGRDTDDGVETGPFTLSVAPAP